MLLMNWLERFKLSVPETVCDHACYYSHEILCSVERKLLLFAIWNRMTEILNGGGGFNSIVWENHIGKF